MPVTAIHATAIVDPQAELDASVSVGPYTVIGPHVKVAAGTTIITYTLTNSCGSSYLTLAITVTTAPPTAGVITGGAAVCRACSPDWRS